MSNWNCSDGDLCGWCGKLHDGGYSNLVTEMPSGLFGANGELSPLGAVVERAANYLAIRGYLDPDAEEYQPLGVCPLGGGMRV